ncbi:MAG: thioredoxin [Clostridia bacterium]|nr:thioredoxin [Clostridia bacterium]MBR1677382.1 thioredoxin [Clostridia bacterium]
MAIKELNKQQFEEEVLKSDVPVLVDFNAAWCGPCRMMKPILDEIEGENPKFKIVSVNIDEEDELADDYDVTSIPCLVVFKGGEEVNRSVGLISKDEILALAEG